METVDFERELIALREKLLKYALLMFPKREDAEDLIQETLLKALENRVENLGKMWTKMS